MYIMKNVFEVRLGLLTSWATMDKLYLRIVTLTMDCVNIISEKLSPKPK